MQLEVSFREVRSDGESRFGMSTSLNRSRQSHAKTAVALGLSTVEQFQEEVATGYRDKWSFVQGRVKAPDAAWLEDTFSSASSLSPPKVKLRKARDLDVELWPIGDVLGFDSPDVVARVVFGPSASKAKIHTHEQSDRLVMVTRGGGQLLVAPGNPRYFPRSLSRHRLTAGDMVFIARGTPHSFHPAPEGAEALVWHCPYIAHGEPDYETVFKSVAMAKVVPLNAVMRDQLLLSIANAVHRGFTDTVGLCQRLHRDRETVEQALRGLERRRIVVRNDDGSWSLHPTFRIEVKDGQVHLIREEDGVVARVSNKLRR